MSGTEPAVSECRQASAFGVNAGLHFNVVVKTETSSSEVQGLAREMLLLGRTAERPAVTARTLAGAFRTELAEEPPVTVGGTVSILFL